MRPLTNQELIEREQLINKLRYLYDIHKQKVEEYRHNANLSDEYACCTKELLLIAGEYHNMFRLNITPEDYS